jgi:ADP-ribose pyrophosphatase YjhB (NUDIX family)
MDTSNVAKIFIMKKDSVLLLLSKKLNKWHLPGGHLEVGESFSKGLRREVKEETGQELKFFHFIQQKPNGKLYIGQLKNDNISISKDEHDDFKWVKIDNLQAERLCKFTLRDAKYLQSIFNAVKHTIQKSKLL